jgi:Right handed beta helix region
MKAVGMVGLVFLVVVISSGSCWSAPQESAAIAGWSPVVTYRVATLVEDTVWRGNVLVEGGLTVAPQITLTITPGTVVRFVALSAEKSEARPALLVQGRLVAQGSADQPILFTGSGKEPAGVTWQGILLVGSEKSNLLEHVRIKEAMVGIDALFSRLTVKSVWADRCGTGFRVQDSLFEALGGLVAGCGIGLHLIDAEAAVRGVQVQRNRQGVVCRRGSIVLQSNEIATNEKDGVLIYGSRLNLEQNKIVQNGIGLVVEGGEGTVRGNRIAHQQGNGVQLTNARIRFQNNLVTGNGATGLLVRDGRAVAFGNALHANGGFDLMNEGQEEFRAPGNWWGGDEPLVGKRLGGTGAVIVTPILSQAPPEI